ncbi:MAG: arsenite S-adenosylmethyltransferase, partial [Bacteroidota bacterium]
FSISDVVVEGSLPEGLRKDAEMYAGCVSGAIQKEVYLELIHTNGFENISIQKEKAINIPEDILKNYLNEKEISSFKNGTAGIFSLTVFYRKTILNKNSACTPGGGCC